MARLVVEKPRANVPRLEFGQKKRERVEAEKNKTRAEKLFEFVEEDPDSKVSFGTKSHRLMFPLYVPDTSFGQQMMPKGLELPQVGPGRYDNEDKTNLLYTLESHVETNKGTIMGGRTADRFQRDTSDVLFTPAPCAYIGNKPWETPTTKLPAFGSSSSSKSRFPAITQEKSSGPAPGRYAHDVPRDRRPLQHHTFGGPKVLRVAAKELRPSPSLKPTKNDDRFIRHGYQYQPDFEERYGKAYLSAFYQPIHQGGANHRLSVLEGQDARQMLHKKAYLHRYFEDGPPPATPEPGQIEAI